MIHANGLSLQSASSTGSTGPTDWVVGAGAWGVRPCHRPNGQL